MKKSLLIIFCFFSVLLSVVALAETDRAIARTNAMIESIKAVDSNQEISYKNFEEFIDVVTIIDEAIAPHLSYFNDAQLKEFKNAMLTLVRKVAYPSSNEFVTTTKYEITGSESHSDFTVVNMNVHIEKENTDMEIGYTWRNVKNRLMLTDIIFDGDSLVKDYQNQFGRILKQEGADALIKKVKDKLDQVETSKKS